MNKVTVVINFLSWNISQSRCLAEKPLCLVDFLKFSSIRASTGVVYAFSSTTGTIFTIVTSYNLLVTD